MFPELYITSLCLIYFIPCSVYLLIPFPYLALLPPLPTSNHQFVLCIFESAEHLLMQKVS